MDYSKSNITSHLLSEAAHCGLNNGGLGNVVIYYFDYLIIVIEVQWKENFEAVLLKTMHFIFLTLKKLYLRNIDDIGISI